MIYVTSLNLSCTLFYFDIVKFCFHKPNTTIELQCTSENRQPLGHHLDLIPVCLPSMPFVCLCVCMCMSVCLSVRWFICPSCSLLVEWSSTGKSTTVFLSFGVSFRDCSSASSHISLVD